MSIPTATIVDGNNAKQTVVANSVSSNLMPVINDGDPLTASTSATPFFNDAIAGTKTQIKATVGSLYWMKLLNTTAAAAYLQIFFLPSSGVTVGSTTADMTVRLAANESLTLNLNKLPPGGLKSDGTTAGTGITMAGTTTATGSTGAAISVAALFS